VVCKRTNLDEYLSDSTSPNRLLTLYIRRGRERRNFHSWSGGILGEVTLQLYDMPGFSNTKNSALK